ncbi:MAG: glycine betaine ABC transporter substrate-binding protein [Lentisphaerae bacterium]|nr:glycine betaine ABC transporter substrate-binding protein [Lentisphaerota bacterium]
MKSTGTLNWMALALAGALTLAVGCGRKTESPAQNKSKGTVKLAYVNWAEGVAVTHLLTTLLEDMDYTVETTMADVAPIYASVADGNQDVMVETWLPAMHKAYYEKYGDQLDLISTWFDEGRVGLVVPAYVEIDSIEQLNGARDRFKGRITGIDSGAGIMGTTEKAIEAYSLDMELLASSGPAMTAALKGAIDQKDWIVVTGWAPHWKFARYDLKFLDDPKGVYGDIERVQMAVRKGFADDFPEVAALLGNLKFDSAQIGSLMDAMESGDGSEEARVRRWIEDNRTLVNSWLP